MTQAVARFAGRVHRPGAPSFARLIIAGLLIVTSAAVVSCDRRDADAPIRLEFWTLSLRPHFTEYMNDLVARFEAENPGIDVVWVDVPFDAVQRKFIASAAAGRSPDVVNLSDGFYARLAALGGLADMSAHLTEEQLEAYLPGALSLGRINDGVYALPWYLASSVTFANESLLAEGGLTPADVASDWAGIRDQARAFHRKTGKFLICPTLGEESRIPQWLIGEGLVPLRPKTDGAGLESNLDDPRIVQFIEDWVNLYREGVLPTESAVGGHAPMIDLYQNGRTALLMTGPNFLQRIRDAAPDVYRRTTILPAIRGASGKYEIATMLLSVSSQSRHPAEAAKLAAFVTRDDNQLAFARIVNILPSTSASLEDPLFTAPADPQDKIALARHISAESMKHAMSHIPALPAWPELTRAFSERIKSALLDGRDVRRTLEEIGREWDGILASHLPATMEVFPAEARAPNEVTP